MKAMVSTGRTSWDSRVLGKLHPRIRELVEELGWKELTDIQLKAIPAVLSGANTVIVAPTGQGKTEAALLPILSMMLSMSAKPVALLYITPLRALINDIFERISWWANRLGLEVARKHGDVPQSERSRRLRRIPHIVVTTPESLEIDLDWAPRFREHYRNLRWVVVDEVHEVVATKRGVQLSVLLERLRRLAGDFQLILLSATIGDPYTVGRAFTGSSKRELKVVSSSVEKSVSITVDYVEPGTDFWRRAAEKVASYIEPLTLVFVNSKHVAERLHEELEKLGLKDVYVHHASISGRERETIEKLAREGKVTAIICTKTLELGIDIGSVRRVVLFRPSGTAASLMQRVGRSGHRVHGRSEGVVIATDVVELFEALAEARLGLKGIVEPPRLPRKPLDVAARSLIGMALAGSYTVDEAYSILKSVHYFSDMERSEFDALLSKLVELKMVKVENGVLKPSARFYKIWSFEDRDRYSWWMRSFSEFFTLIGERDTFTVKDVEGRTVGELDTEYVYRLVRPGTVVRLSGRNWKVMSIDEANQRITVVEEREEAPTIPSWKGRGPEVSRNVVEEMVNVMKQAVEKGVDAVLVNGLHLSDDARRALEAYVNHVRRYKVPQPDTRTLILERVGDEAVIVSLLGERVNRTIAYALMAAMNLDYVRVSYYGFSLPLTSSVDQATLVKRLASMDPGELASIVWKVVPRTSFFAEEAKHIQLSFGITRRLSIEDGIVYEEVVKQVVEEYFDVEEASKVLEGIANGSVRIVAGSGPNPVALELLREAPEKLWSSGVEDLIASSLKGMAFTVEEIAEMITVPVELVEAKLKEMRRNGSRFRVFSFIDVDTNEERWALVSDAKNIAESEEFSSSFRPEATDEMYLVLVKGKEGGLIHMTVTPKEALADPESIAKKVPFREAIEVKVVPLSGFEDHSLKYSYVPKELIPYLVLNAITVIQRLRSSDII